MLEIKYLSRPPHGGQIINRQMSGVRNNGLFPLLDIHTGHNCPKNDSTSLPINGLVSDMGLIPVYKCDGP